MNPQKQLNLLRQMCHKNIENYNHATQNNKNAAETKDNTTKKENEDNV